MGDAPATFPTPQQVTLGRLAKATKHLVDLREKIMRQLDTAVGPEYSVPVPPMTAAARRAVLDQIEQELGQAGWEIHDITDDQRDGVFLHFRPAPTTNDGGPSD